jgi:agmatine deiminase
MPAEWEPHARTWMAWPTQEWNADGEAGASWAAVAHAIAPFEPVTMIVSPDDEAQARAALDPRIDLLIAPLDDAWMRDIGPTFVRSDDGGIAGVDWVFNGWGQQSWATWEHDAKIGRVVCDGAGVGVIRSAMVNEGGGIHVDGRGTVLLTETVQLGEGRNPRWTRQQVEAELARTIGADRFVWIEEGLSRDYDEFGTRGHIDIVACFVPSGAVLVHDQRNPAHPDHAISEKVKAVMRDAGLQVIELPAPEVLQDEHGFVDYSYVNHYVCNGAVILCAFDDPADEQAAEILARCYPDREIVLVDARPIFARGGGIHCITQQQPA